MAMTGIGLQQQLTPSQQQNSNRIRLTRDMRQYESLDILEEHQQRLVELERNRKVKDQLRKNEKERAL